jgi:ABC-2 type transport system permease protein
MNGKIMAVVRREFITRVKSRAFIITLVLLPVMLLLFAVVPMLLLNQSARTTRVAVVDGTVNHLGQRVADALGDRKTDDDEDGNPLYDLKWIAAPNHAKHAGKRLIGQTGFSDDAKPGRYDGVLVLRSDVLKSGEVAYYGNNVSSLKAMKTLQYSLSKVFSAERLTDAGMDVATVTRAMRPVDLSAKGVSDGKLTGKSGAASFAVAYGMGFLLYLGIALFGQQTMSSVIEEKTSRVMEVLVSALTPFEMLSGKVLGVGAAGLLQMAIWGMAALIITNHAPRLAAMFGAAPGALSSFAMPHISGELVAMFLIYFTLGFLLYGALYAAVGAICNSPRETQQYAVVIRIFIMIGFFSMFGIISNPTGPLADIMPWVPFFAPFTMPVRWSLVAVPRADLIGSLVLMLVGLWVCVWIAARIYNIGILMYGKKPSWRELRRWVLPR